MYGSAPMSRHSAMNSWIPTSLCSTPFHAGFFRGGRRSRSPMPSRQSYPLTKLPPGQRYTGAFSSRSSARTSGRKPSTLLAGMSETVPIRNRPFPRAAISRRASSEDAPAVNAIGYGR